MEKCSGRERILGNFKPLPLFLLRAQAKDVRRITKRTCSTWSAAQSDAEEEEEREFSNRILDGCLLLNASILTCLARSTKYSLAFFLLAGPSNLNAIIWNMTFNYFTGARETKKARERAKRREQPGSRARVFCCSSSSQSVDSQWSWWMHTTNSLQATYTCSRSSCWTFSSIDQSLPTGNWDPISQLVRVWVREKIFLKKTKTNQNFNSNTFFPAIFLNFFLSGPRENPSQSIGLIDQSFFIVFLLLVVVVWLICSQGKQKGILGPLTVGKQTTPFTATTTNRPKNPYIPNKVNTWARLKKFFEAETGKS